MSKLSPRYMAVSAPLILLFSAWFAPANASVISTCDTSIPIASRSCSAGDVSQGWDGAGLGSFNFGYFIGNPFRADGGLPSGFNASQVEAVFLAAAATWSSVIDVTFTSVAAFGAGEIDFYFHTTDNSIPFDGAINPSAGTGLVFAHTWGPNDVSFSVASGISNPGNMHFDIDEQWVTSGAPNFSFGVSSLAIDLESIILHELGHVLGLGHEDSFGRGLGLPVMQSFYNGEFRTLTADDIAGARSLYACVGDGCGPPPPCTGPDCPCTGPDCPDDPPTTVPEPGTLFLFAIGLFGLAMNRRKRRASQVA